MRNLKQKKRVTVLGLGETGLLSALFLKRKGYSVFVSDAQVSEILKKRSLQLKEEKIPHELAKHSLEKIAECDWVLISPGIPPSSEVYRFLQEKKIPMVSEIETASWFSKGRVTAVTGTSGKTTAATLLQRIYEANGLLSVVCGNIGNPWIGEADRLDRDTEIVLEISSFQLVHTYSFAPHIGILLNVGLNHLDWHASMQEYIQAKLRLFQNQSSHDFALLREQDQKNLFPDFHFPSRVVYFGGEEGRNSNEQLLFEITKLRGLDPEKTWSVLTGFSGLEHRLERVRAINGIQFINDSKCTTIEALIWALDQSPDGHVILLAGGHDKGADFRLVRERLAKKVKRAIVFGEAQDLLWESWNGAAPLTKVQGLSEAFQEALKIAKPGNIILLSPACASFDQFPNYKERGRLFKELVAAL
ncbi:MAG: hypothetical protein HY447_01755 [Candidatus Omnitrophica bacterium]|nr:hypothetical protein [Candidatus Omnitrophota bacterium]